MDKIAEKKLLKLISERSLFWNGMLLTSDEIYGKFQGYSCNINLNIKTNRERIYIKKFVDKLPLNSLQKVLHILIETQLESNKTTRMGYKIEYKLEEVERDYMEFREMEEDINTEKVN